MQGLEWLLLRMIPSNVEEFMRNVGLNSILQNWDSEIAVIVCMENHFTPWTSAGEEILSVILMQHML